ncbi:hydrolase [Coprinopsis cinerea okayama7|uniref:Hydrolase n=1 Tax=Coprinopsis cinerea (strain Okayama-7 / 130 / ATCC MYA-4618 / FGSC 9003) TaxID=240176 RepID=A8NQZ2_COPC7|nr:hydrolase [Coprinopsis cinerea okayama7\|eukprot:XP_001835582.2 hydrolase [Coprinopsis cinerea okayama7\
MASSLSKLRVAVVQLNPKLGQVQANIQRARELCSNLQPHTLDLICFPEMAFTGYVFDDAEAIGPYLEERHTGPTSQFCAELAKKLNCYVMAGYPERLSEAERAEPVVDTEKSCPNPVGANSAVVYGRNGELVSHYRKSNLYDTDMTWAKPGTGFAFLKLPDPLRSVSLGICMDLNPERGKTWSLEEGPYEIADHCLKNKTNLLVLLNSWLESPYNPVDEDDNDWSTLEYWAARLRPLWAKDDSGLRKNDSSHQPKETIVVLCNRSGSENGKTFAGTSAVFKLTKGVGRPVLLDMMTKGEEGVKVWHIAI